MSGNLATNIIIGAALAGNFQATIGQVVSGVGQVKSSVGQLGQALADVGAAWATLAAIKDVKDIAADLEHKLMQTGITADMTNDRIVGLKNQLRDLAVSDRTNQSVEDLLKGFTSLVSAGMAEGKASTMLEAIGRTATAASSDIDDLAKTAFVLTDTLGVAPEGMAKALDQLAFAGKQGAFELKDMARYFPTLGAAAKNLGLQGTEAVTTLGAALQIAKKGAADPSEAANNMKNFLAKATSPDTVKKFAEHGVNLKKTLRDAMANGENPMEVLIQKIQAMTKGDPFKIGELFGDMQVMDFLKPMLANMEEYKRLKAEIGGASGTVDTDFARMMTTNKEAAKGFSVELYKMKEAVGSALIGGIGGAGEKALTPLVRSLGDFIAASPTATNSIVTLGSAAVVLPSAFRLATIAWKTMNVAVVFSPIGLAIGALAVGATLIIQHWTEVKAFASTIWNGVAEHWRTILAFTGPIGWMAIKIIDNFELIRSTALALWNGVAEKWGELMTVVAPIGEAITGIFDGVWTKVTAAWDAGVANIMAIWERVRGPLTDFAKMMGWIAPDGGKVPAIGAAVQAPPAVNDNTANDNVPQVGSVVSAANGRPAVPSLGAGVAAAEAKGAAVMAGGGAAGGTAAGTGPTGTSGSGPQHFVVELLLPAGMRAEMRGAAPPGVSVIARTGQSRVGSN